MDNNSKITDQDKRTQNESRELFKCALLEAIYMEIREIEKENKDMGTPPTSKRHKIKMNRFFRERVGGSFIPFPEEDNLYERLRSKIIIKLKTNDFFDRLKELKR